MQVANLTLQLVGQSFVITALPVSHLRGIAGLMTFHFSGTGLSPTLWGKTDGISTALSPARK